MNVYFTVLFMGLAVGLFTNCAIPVKREVLSFSKMKGVQELEGVTPAVNLEEEIVHLSSKVSSLETKLEVLTESLRILKGRDGQPKIVAQEMSQEMVQEMEIGNSEEEMPMRRDFIIQKVSTVDRNMSRKTSKETMQEAAVEDDLSLSPIEKEFQQAKILYDARKYERASLGFIDFVERHKDHGLASSALYWAGKSSMADKDWLSAIVHWSKLEKEFPKALQMPEALAGLSKAYGVSFNVSQSHHYRKLLLRSFPDSPTTLDFISSTGEEE